MKVLGSLMFVFLFKISVLTHYKTKYSANQQIQEYYQRIDFQIEFNIFNNNQIQKMTEQSSSLELDELLYLIHQTDLNLSKQRVSKQVILLMGQSQVGKTTLLYYLLGKKLIWQTNDLQVLQMTPEAIYNNAIIGSQYESTTVYPNIQPYQSQQQVLIIDMPGFDDSRLPFKLINIYILIESLRLINSVHICQVLSEQSVNDAQIMNKFQKICSLYNQKLMGAHKYISFMLTKVEDEQTKQHFFDQIQQFQNQNYPLKMKEDVKRFKQRNIYQFLNSQPIIEQGKLLKQQIIAKNQFITINKHPLSLLSQSYCDVMLGSHNLQQFWSYLNLVIQQINHNLLPLVSLAIIVLKFQFQEIFCQIQEQERQNYQRQLKKQIQQQFVKIKLKQFGKQKLLFSNCRNMSKQKCMNYFRCLQIMEQNQHEQSNVIKIVHALAVFTNIINNQQPKCCSETLLQLLHSSLKNMNSLISILKQIKQPEFVNKFTILIKNQEVYKLFENYQNKCIQNKQKAGNLPNVLALISDQEGKQLLAILKIQQSDNGFIIQKMQQMHLISKKEVLTAIQHAQNKVKHKTKQDKIIIQQQEKQQLQLQLFDKINKLPFSINSLPFLIQMLTYHKQHNNLTNEQLFLILQKIGDILYTMSYLQQSICFKMAASDNNSIHQLLQVATSNKQISLSFIIQIVVPYYIYINPSLEELELCENYICNLEGRLGNGGEWKEELAIGRQKILKMVDGNQLPQKIRRFDFHYIDSILDNFEQLFKSLQIREQLYRKTPLFLPQLMQYIKVNPNS